MASHRRCCTVPLLQTHRRGTGASEGQDASHTAEGNRRDASRHQERRNRPSSCGRLPGCSPHVMAQYGAQGGETIIVRFSSLHSSYYFSALGPGNFEGRQVEAAILLIGEYPALLSTRVHLLKEWQTSTTDSEAAAQALRKRRYDRLIFCQSIRGPRYKS
jgi:hypothetical protein